MVSTHSQYITDFTPTSSVEAGKSPLAMLAKTCETIGLPDTPSKKSPTEKKDDVKKAESPTDRRKERSPRATPTTTARVEPTASTTFAGLTKPTFPLGFSPGLPFPFGYPMMPYAMSFPSFPMSFAMARPPCPSMMLQRPCVTPGCTSCSADMLNSFATHPLFSTYSSMMPTVSSATMLPASYQNLLATSCSVPSTSAPSPNSSAKTSTQGRQHMCSWVESTGICGKQFASADELASHVKQLHTPSPPSSSSSSSADAGKTPLSRSNMPRFHPYSKPTTASAAAPFSMPPMMSFPPALQAMYAQRLMSTMPHP